MTLPEERFEYTLQVLECLDLTLDRTESPWFTLLDAFLSADFDEQTADDWDVDMSVYYDTGTGPGLAVLGDGMVPWPCSDTLPDLLSRVCDRAPVS